MYYRASKSSSFCRLDSDFPLLFRNPGKRMTGQVTPLKSQRPMRPLTVLTYVQGCGVYPVTEGLREFCRSLLIAFRPLTSEQQGTHYTRPVASAAELRLSSGSATSETRRHISSRLFRREGKRNLYRMIEATLASVITLNAVNYVIVYWREAIKCDRYSSVRRFVIFRYTVDFDTIRTQQQSSIAIGCCLLEKAFSYSTDPLRIRQHRHGSCVIRVQTVETCRKVIQPIKTGNDELHLFRNIVYWQHPGNDELHLFRNIVYRQHPGNDELHLFRNIVYRQHPGNNELHLFRNIVYRQHPGNDELHLFRNIVYRQHPGNDELHLFMKRFGRLFTARSGDPMRAIEVSMERRRNERSEENGKSLRENPTYAIIRHESHLRKSGEPGRGLNPLWEQKPVLFLNIHDCQLKLPTPVFVDKMGTLFIVFSSPLFPSFTVIDWRILRPIYTTSVSGAQQIAGEKKSCALLAKPKRVSVLPWKTKMVKTLQIKLFKTPSICQQITGALDAKLLVTPLVFYGDGSTPCSVIKAFSADFTPRRSLSPPFYALLARRFVVYAHLSLNVAQFSELSKKLCLEAFRGLSNLAGSIWEVLHILSLTARDKGNAPEHSFSDNLRNSIRWWFRSARVSLGLSRLHAAVRLCKYPSTYWIIASPTFRHSFGHASSTGQGERPGASLNDHLRFPVLSEATSDGKTVLAGSVSNGKRTSSSLEGLCSHQVDWARGDGQGNRAEKKKKKKKKKSLSPSGFSLLIKFDQGRGKALCAVVEGHVSEFAGLLTSRSREPMRIKRGEYGEAPERNGGGNGRPPRKSAGQRHRPARFPNVRIREQRRPYSNEQAKIISSRLNYKKFRYKKNYESFSVLFGKIKLQEHIQATVQRFSITIEKHRSRTELNKRSVTNVHAVRSSICTNVFSWRGAGRSWTVNRFCAFRSGAKKNGTQLFRVLWETDRSIEGIALTNASPGTRRPDLLVGTPAGCSGDLSPTAPLAGSMAPFTLLAPPHVLVLEMPSYWFPLCTEGAVSQYTALRQKHFTIARKSDDALGVRVTFARIAPSLLDLGHAAT
ncbi:hypothetical protein PR048_030345 [Dryococelus australis]|uniref:Uncharacterized protein n=1 Tax=Dryococelus australis TaxID=614101 RepID=A0ABQ9G8Q2_9NEOP|nr:hypothetical protein PR048_030345 [Dryococelus australis]